MSPETPQAWLAAWRQEWLGVIAPLGQIVLVLLGAWLLHRLIRRATTRLEARYALPMALMLAVRRVLAFVIYSTALLLVLERMGVSGTALWTAFTGFAAVGAVAFFAAWSVLSNIFCTVLIFTTGLFRLNDWVELLENGEKPGFRGRVVDINMVFTSLEEVGEAQAGSVLRVPNSLFFQRSVRRWRAGPAPRHWIERETNVAEAPTAADPAAPPVSASATS